MVPYYREIRHRKIHHRFMEVHELLLESVLSKITSDNGKGIVALCIDMFDRVRQLAIVIMRVREQRYLKWCSVVAIHGIDELEIFCSCIQVSIGNLRLVWAVRKPRITARRNGDEEIKKSDFTGKCATHNKPES